MSTPQVQPCRVFPKGSSNPAGAVVVCPHCGERHWLALSSASQLHDCPKTEQQFLVELSTAEPEDWNR